jgi:hypothetical protein
MNRLVPAGETVSVSPEIGGWKRTMSELTTRARIRASHNCSTSRRKIDDPRSLETTLVKMKDNIPCTLTCKLRKCAKNVLEDDKENQQERDHEGKEQASNSLCNNQGKVQSAVRVMKASCRSIKNG